MGFGEAISDGFFNFANFRDRASRSAFWWWMLFLLICGAVAYAIDLIAFRGQANIGGMPIGPFYLVVAIAAILPSVAVSARRLHDTNRTGWWLLIPYGGAAAISLLPAFGVDVEDPNPDARTLLLLAIPGLITLVGVVITFIFFLLAGTKGNNKYGPDPYAGM